MSSTRSKQGMVLQGYFRSEQFRGRRAAAPLTMPPRWPSGAAQARAAVPGKPWPHAPRADLLPIAMRSAVQGKPAPRLDLRPGMGPPRGVTQARSTQGISSTQLPTGQLRLIGDGRPLDPGIRHTMEAFFDADFSNVRVHEGPMAQAIGALAFTVGETLYFAPGLYDPTTREGVELLGHELTHVVQQRDGRVVNPHGAGVAIVQDPALEDEADRMGQQIAAEMASHAAIGQPRRAAPTAGSALPPALPFPGASRGFPRTAQAAAASSVRAVFTLAPYDYEIDSGSWSNGADASVYYYTNAATNALAGKDAEVKALSVIRRQLRKLEDHDIRAQGTLQIRGDRGPCSSCRAVITQFRLDFPFVKVECRYTQLNKQAANGTIGGQNGFDDAKSSGGAWWKIFGLSLATEEKLLKEELTLGSRHGSIIYTNAEIAKMLA